jgi:hypothetical protein
METTYRIKILYESNGSVREAMIKTISSEQDLINDMKKLFTDYKLDEPNSGDQIIYIIYWDKNDNAGIIREKDTKVEAIAGFKTIKHIIV